MKRKDDAPSEECIRLLEQNDPTAAYIRRLRSEVRRLKAALRRWLQRGPLVPTMLQEMRDALRGKPAPRRGKP